MHARQLKAVRLLVIPTLVSLVAAGPAPRLADATDPSAKLDMAYVRRVVEDLTAIGSTELGMRIFGTPQDVAAADYVASQMTSLGLQSVALESVPGDSWTFDGASVALTGDLTKTYRAGSMGGVAGTPPEGVSGPLVFAGLGTARDYAHLHLNAHGKIVIAWWDPTVSWANLPALEAKARGAKALLLAVPNGGPYFQGANALGSFDATCDPTLCVPFVTITTKAASRIIRQLESGASIDATVVLDATNQSANGYNTYGVIPGTDSSHVIVIGAHHDAWWFGAVDDATGVAMILALAKAVIETGEQPRYTWVFTTHTGEEYGLSGAHYDWLTGAWWQITQAHPEWQGNAVAFVNWEGHDPPYRLSVDVTRELASFVKGRLRASGDLLTDGYAVTDIGPWTEGWTFGAAGVPSITFGQMDPAFVLNRYHTQLDTSEEIDFKALEPVLRAESDLVNVLDERTTYPYGFKFRLWSLKASLDYTLMKAWGYEPGIMRSAFRATSDAWDAAAAARADARPVCFNAALRSAVETSLQGFTALDAFDRTIYPHQQVENDAWYLEKAVVSLRYGDWRTALTSLQNVAQTRYVPLLAKDWFEAEMASHDPDDPKIAWGAQGHLAPFLDLWDVYTSVRKKGRAGGADFADEIKMLRRARDAAKRLYRARLDEMTDTMGAVSDDLLEAAAC
jgi:hypothetical protein